MIPREKLFHLTTVRSFPICHFSCLNVFSFILLWVKLSAGSLGGYSKDKQIGMGQGLSKNSDNNNMDNTGNFPTTLEGFGYEIKDGKLRNCKTGGKFVFDVKKGNRRYNQRHYEALGESLTPIIYDMLEKEVGLERVTIPVDRKSEKKEPESIVFMSNGYEKEKKLMVLIHGTGVVRAGQWARSLIINDCLDTGTQLPYIRRAIKEGYGVVVLNTNQNTDINGEDRPVKGSETPEDHFIYVWDTFLKDCQADDIVIVAHSYGGVVTLEAVKSRTEMMSKVKAIAFTDGVHSLFHQAGKNRKVVEWFKQHSINWMSSNLPLNEELRSLNGSEPKRSAGTMRHEETSSSAIEPIFEYFTRTLSSSTETEVREWIKNGFSQEQNNHVHNSEKVSTKDTEESNSNKIVVDDDSKSEQEEKKNQIENTKSNGEEIQSGVEIHHGLQGDSIEIDKKSNKDDSKENVVEELSENVKEIKTSDPEQCSPIQVSDNPSDSMDLGGISQTPDSQTEHDIEEQEGGQTEEISNSEEMSETKLRDEGVQLMDTNISEETPKSETGEQNGSQLMDTDISEENAKEEIMDMSQQISESGMEGQEDKESKNENNDTQNKDEL